MMDPKLCNSSRTSMYSHYHRIYYNHRHIKNTTTSTTIPQSAVAVLVLVLRGKTPLAQVAVGMNTMSASGVFALVGGRKNTTSASCGVSRPSWAQVYRSGMQQANVACTRPPPQCKSCTCTPTSANTPLALMVVIARCNLRWWCFSSE